MTDNTFRFQIRKHLNELPAYIPIEPYEVLAKRLGFNIHEITKLDANENPYGPSDYVRQALANLSYSHIYPDPESRELRYNLSQYTGNRIENILCGAGADELIDLILRVFINPGDLVANFPPTFGMYQFDTLLNHGAVLEIPRLPDFQINLDRTIGRIDQSKVKVIFLANPNNPDGSMIGKADIKKILGLPVLLVIDEAYIEFSNPSSLGRENSVIDLVSDYDNLIVLRTFSKWAGLAGLRLGYGIFPQWMMPILWKAKQPYNVNYAASTAAIAAMNDIDNQVQRIRMIVEERTRLAAKLNAIAELHVYPSRANFVLCKVDRLEAGVLKKILAEQYAILVRYFDKPGLTNHIRITVGKPADTDRLMAALSEIFIH